MVLGNIYRLEKAKTPHSHVQNVKSIKCLKAKSIKVVTTIMYNECQM